MHQRDSFDKSSKGVRERERKEGGAKKSGKKHIWKICLPEEPYLLASLNHMTLLTATTELAPRKLE